jgi:hypothetical protein
MGTRSNISVLEKNGKVKMIYCHWDGYPSWNGKVLLTAYNSEAQARELVSLGDISSLCAQIAPPTGVVHTFDKPATDVTVAYHRDRKEKWADVKPTTFPTLKAAKSKMQEFLYVWNVEKGKWFFTDGKMGLVELTPEACEEI